MNIIDFYKSLFESLGLSVLDDGTVCVSNAEGDDYEPVKMPGTMKTLIVPTTEFLKNPDYSKYTPFHPMYENIMNKDAPTLIFIRNLIIATVNRRYIATISSIINFIAGVKSSDKIISTQLEICKKLPNIDEKSAKSINDVLQKIESKLTSMTSSIVYPVIRPTNKNVTAEQNYNKVVETIFPLYNLIEKNKDETLLGVKLRKKDIQTLKDLYTKVLFDKIPNGYTYYSGSLAASNLHALLTWYVSITMEYNALNSEMLYDTVPLNFSEGLNDFEALKIQIPLLPDNDGEPKVRINKKSVGLTSNNLKDISEIPVPVPSTAPAAPVMVQPAPVTPVQQVQSPVMVQQPVQQTVAPPQQQPQQQLQVQGQQPYQEREGVDYVYEQIGNQRCKKYLNTAAYQASLGIQPMVQTVYGPMMPPVVQYDVYGRPIQPVIPPAQYTQQYPVQAPPYAQYPSPQMPAQSVPFGYPMTYPRQMPYVDPRTTVGRASNPAAYGMATYNNPAMMPPVQRGRPYR